MHDGSSSGPPTLSVLTSQARSEPCELYEEALIELLRKVPDVMSMEEYNSFVEASASPNSNQEHHVRNTLEALQTDQNYRRRFHAFFEAVGKFLGPLHLFKDGLDTLCQAHPVASLVWGSIKILISVCTITLWTVQFAYCTRVAPSVPCDVLTHNANRSLPKSRKFPPLSAKASTVS